MRKWASPISAVRRPVPLTLAALEHGLPDCADRPEHTDKATNIRAIHAEIPAERRHTALLALQLLDSERPEQANRTSCSHIKVAKGWRDS